ncbi:thioesterase family protein [Novosphingobium profundi]|uniref:thioesterase family protein n=1 Tax=Novosphingobium profundi TaxID=1774954 RepID=UPI001BDADDD3|nr:thioesterase family protein [Novosphingobium profundi]MBT0667543.1 thioesterase family protein [Novosphingobium profundi]
MAGLGAILAAAQPRDGGFAVEIGPDWLQGRTAYGGVSSALALEAARRVLPAERALELPLQSAQFSMMAPLAGRVEARGRIVREGRNAIWVTAELVGEKGTGFLANCVFMAKRASALSLAGYPMPEAVIPLEQASGFEGIRLPAFMAEHFETRVALAGPDLGQADLCWWVRLRDAQGLAPEVEAVLVGDALPTAVLPLLPAGTPISSMQWHVNMLDAATRPRDGWWLIRSTCRQSATGLASEDIVQWRSDGTPVIAGMQSVAVFG